jgi:hypothetical protein
MRAPQPQPLNSVQIPANANGGPSSLSANQTTSFFRCYRCDSAARLGGDEVDINELQMVINC